MKNESTRSRNFVTADFFVLRTPILSWTEFVNWGAGLGAPRSLAGSDSELQRALEDDAVLLHERLKRVLAIPEIRESIFVASPDLEASLGAWETDPMSEKGRRTERSVLRYFARMSGRATPFGLFAGCTLGMIGDHTALRLAARFAYRRSTRLDTHYLAELCEALRGDPTLANELTYRPNTSLYEAGGRWHYMESRSTRNGNRYNLVAVDDSEYLRDVLSWSRGGCSIDDLAEALAAPDITVAEAAAFVHELIDAQVLVADLAPLVTGGNALENLVDQLAGSAAGEPIAACLRSVADDLRALDTTHVVSSSRTYLDVAEKLRTLPAPVDIARLFQVDMVVETEIAMLGRDVLEVAEEAVTVLHRLAGPFDPLQGFRQAFRERYEGEEVPLCQVLDLEVGIGLPGRVAGSATVTPDTAAADEFERSRQTVLAELLTTRTGGEDNELVLTEADLRRLSVNHSRPLPTSFHLSTTIVASSEEALRDGTFRIINNGAAGPSGANLLGRFCHCDIGLTTVATSYLHSEASLEPDAVFAEVVHMPEGRLGNVISRPVLREYEIPFLGRSGASPERQIPVTDLLVSIDRNRVVLRSARLGREVIPRCTTAHNFGHPRNLPIYQFLGWVARQGVVAGLDWHWGRLEALPSLPRIVYGRTVLARARWTVRAADAKTLTVPTRVARYRAIQDLRTSLKLPRYVNIVEGDNHLPIDLEAVTSAEILADVARKRGGMTLVEMYPSQGTLLAKGPEGHYLHEVIIPFTQKQEARLPKEKAVDIPSGRVVQRRFGPTSDWTYLKLYVGQGSADRVLLGVVAPLVRAAQASGAVDRWFFLRYSDPQFHLRLRLHGQARRIQSEILPEIEESTKKWLDSGVICGIQYDSYRREVERYGGPAAIEHAEAIFHIDSEAVLDLIAEYSGDANADLRRDVALRGIDAMLTDFGVDGETGLSVLKALPTPPGNARHSWGEQYRAHKKRIEFALSAKALDDVRLGAAARILARRSERIEDTIQNLRQVLPEDGARALKSVAFSHIHMHLNRLLRGTTASQEQMLLDFVRRARESVLARARKRVGV